MHGFLLAYRFARRLVSHQTNISAKFGQKNQNTLMLNHAKTPWDSTTNQLEVPGQQAFTG
jgi:hypothetical protein